MYRYLPLLIIVALIPGCGLLSDLFGPFDSETGSSELKTFESEKELADYFADQIAARNRQFTEVDVFGRSQGGALDLTADEAAGSGSDGDAGAPPAPEAPTSEAGGNVNTGASDDDFSQTTIQEEGVDEADVVKTDGTYLYIIHGEWDGSTLRIVRVSPPEQLALLSEVSLEGYGREIYLHDGKVVALTEMSGGFYGIGSGGVSVGSGPVPEVDVGTVDVDADDGGEDAKPDDEVDIESDGEGDAIEPDGNGEMRYERPRTIVTVIDASVPDNPTILSQTRFDGTQYSSRMIDGVLHLVLANYQQYYYDVMPLLGQSELDVSAVDVATLLPGFERIGADGAEQSGNAVTWQELYRPTDPDGFGVVAVVSLDVDNNSEFSAVGVVAEPGLIYSSLNALYLTDTEYTFSGNTRETTDVYKIAYVDRGVLPVATGSVEGRILNQYSMGEHDYSAQGHGRCLRVATTIGPTFTLFGTRRESENRVYVLGQTNNTLQVVGSVQGIAPGETIQSARFIGDRGYVVTFEQIDPLFTLNLSDPTNPTVVGELKVPGFSTFLVPMDADHLLAVGQYIPEDGSFFGWGIQLSIFDVSDFANPQRTADIVLGEQGEASSEALYNPKAFTYFAERGLVALPVSIYDDIFFFDFTGDDGPVTNTDDDDRLDPAQTDSDEAPDSGSDAEPPPDEIIENIDTYVPQGFEGLVVYSVSVEDGFTELGRISTRFEEAGYYWNSFTRGVFIGDDVFAVTDHGVRGTLVSDFTSIPYELILESISPPDEPWPAGDQAVLLP